MLRHAVATGDIKTAVAELDKLWQQRYKHGGFGLQHVSDAAWVLHRTSGDAAAHILLWPKLLSLLSRWSYSAAPRGPSANAAPAPKGPGAQQVVPGDSPSAAVPALRSWLVAQLATRQLPWVVKAPALLFIAISSAGASSLTDRTEACGAIAASLQRLRRAREQPGAWAPPPGGPEAGMPQGPTLGAAEARELMSPASHTAVQDLCTAAQLMLEALAADGDARSFCGLLGDLAGGLGEAAAATAAATVVVAGGRPGSGGLSSWPAAVSGSAAGSPAAGVAAAAAAAAQQGLAAMAVLHGSCRQLGMAVVRAAAAAPPSGAGAAPAIAPGSQTAGDKANAGVRSQLGGVGPPAVQTLIAAAGMLQNACSSGAADCAAGRADPYGIAVLGMHCTAAGGMLEGCVLSLRQLHSGRQGEVSRQLLPAVQGLASALGNAAAAAAATAAGVLSASEAGATGPGEAGVSESGAASGTRVLQSAVGLSWARLRNLPPAAPDAVTPCPVRLAHGMAAAAAAPASSHAALFQSGRPLPSAGAASPLLFAPTPWRPARGALRLLLGGVLGLAPLLHEALSGGPPSAGAEWLRQHTGQQGPLFPEAQGLARGVLGALRDAAAAAPPSGPDAERQAQQPPLGAQSAPAAGVAWVLGLIGDLAVATRGLHAMYGAVADTPYGGAWLAALQQLAAPVPSATAAPAAAPPPAEGVSLRDMLDRTFVVVVGVATAALDVVRQQLSPPAARGPAAALPRGFPGGSHVRSAGGGPKMGPMPDEQLVGAVALLGALSDMQFCALQLRAHGELVAALGALVAAAPREAAGPLIALLPCYPDLAAAYELASMPAPAPAAAAAWQQHGVSPVGVAAGAGAAVAVSRLAFVLPLAASCVPYAADVGVAASAVLPYVYLLLRDVREGVAQAAHTVWAALLSALCEPPKQLPPPPQPLQPQQRSGWLSYTVSRVASWALGDGTGAVRQGDAGGRLGGSGGAGGPSEACLAIAEAMVPFYVERALGQDVEEGPADTARPATVTAADLDLLERGLARVLQLLPSGHPVKSWCVQRIARQAAQWAHEVQRDQQQDQQPQGGHTGDPTSQPRAAAARVLSQASRAPSHALLFGRSAALLASMVVRVDFPLLPLALRQLDELLAAVGTAERVVMMQAVQDAWVRSDDYARKPLLGEWLQRAVQAAVGAGGWAAGGGGGPEGGAWEGPGGAPPRRLRVLAAAFGVGRSLGQGSVHVHLV